jgi:hypothetical protein
VEFLGTVRFSHRKKNKKVTVTRDQSCNCHVNIFHMVINMPFPKISKCMCIMHGLAPSPQVVDNIRVPLKNTPIIATPSDRRTTRRRAQSSTASPARPPSSRRRCFPTTSVSSPRRSCCFSGTCARGQMIRLRGLWEERTHCKQKKIKMAAIATPASNAADSTSDKSTQSQAEILVSASPCTDSQLYFVHHWNFLLRTRY